MKKVNATEQHKTSHRIGRRYSMPYQEGLTQAKVGDTIYIEYYDGTIGSATIKEITPKYYFDRYGKEVHYNEYRVNEYSTIEDYNCLSEDDPRVQNYIKEQKLKIESQLSSLYDFIKKELDIRELSDIEINIIKTVLKYNNLKEFL